MNPEEIVQAFNTIRGVVESTHGDKRYHDSLSKLLDVIAKALDAYIQSLQGVEIEEE